MSVNLTLADHEEAFTEVSFLLDIFTATVHDMMGGKTAPVGRIAGRHMARKLPVYLPHPGIEDVLAEIARQLRKGFELRASRQGEAMALSFSRCAMRDVCRGRGLAPGGPLCAVFHSYFDGMVNELAHRPVKSHLEAAGEERCEVRMEVR